MLLITLTLLIIISVALSKSNEYRLPTHTRPISYHITIEPNFDTFTFKGFVEIKCRIIDKTNEIVVHIKEITIKSVEVKKEDLLIELNTNQDEIKHFLIITLDQKLLVGDVVYVSIEYDGLIGEKNLGFYRAKSVNANGNESWWGITQLSLNHARKVFPCFDEPSFRATFTLNLIRPRKYNSASNMALLASAKMPNDKAIDIYETSINMATYLVAFIVSELGQIKFNNDSVYGRPDAISDGFGEYALQKSHKVLQIYEDFTGIPYPLNKMDQVGAPDDYFAFGAMENWGLVIYGETSLLYKENISSTEDKQFVLLVITHEYGHQWFGNLVTPTWWEYVWLNEGFATFCEQYAIHKLNPSIRMDEQYVVYVQQFAMREDSIESTRAMTKDPNPLDLMEVIDTIAYKKAGSVIRMTEHFLSKPVFQEGIKKYLKKMSYKAATPTDLFDSLQEAVDDMGAEWLKSNTVHDIFKTWHTQSGFPYINAVRDYEKNILHLTQNRFLFKVNATPSKEIWYVPINYATSSKPDFKNTLPTFWLTKRKDSIENDEPSWIILNKKSSGYYLVNYDNENWSRITTQLIKDHTIIDPINRAELIHDSFSLAEASIIKYDIVYKLIDYITNETDYIPLSCFYKKVKRMEKMLADSEINEPFKAKILNLLEPTYQKLSYKNDIKDHTTIINRVEIHVIMCQFGHKQCLEDMSKRLMNLFETKEAIHPDLQLPVYCGGMANDKDLDVKWKNMYQRLDSTTLGERTRIVQGMACSKNEDILTRTLLTAVGKYKDHDFHGTDPTNALKAVAAESSLGTKIALETFYKNYETPKIPYKLKTEIMKEIIDGLYKPEHKDMLEKLSVIRTSTKLSKEIHNAVSNVDNNLHASREAEAQFAAFLGKNN